MTIRPERALLAFAAAVFFFHQVPAFLPEPAGDAVDVLTPFAVVASSAAVLAGLGADRRAVIVALVAGTLYVHGVGAHLAANSINNELGAEPGGIIDFWDERFSHVEGVLGWFGLVAAFCLAEGRAAAAAARRSRVVLIAAAAVLGWTFFTSTVEGQTWWLELPSAVLFTVWAARARDGRPLLRAAAAAFALGAALIGVWALINGGLPEFSDSGII